MPLGTPTQQAVIPHLPPMSRMRGQNGRKQGGRFQVNVPICATRSAAETCASSVIAFLRDKAVAGAFALGVMLERDEALETILLDDLER